MWHKMTPTTTKNCSRNDNAFVWMCLCMYHPYTIPVCATKARAGDKMRTGVGTLGTCNCQCVSLCVDAAVCGWHYNDDDGDENCITTELSLPCVAMQWRCQQPTKAYSAFRMPNVSSQCFFFFIFHIPHGIEIFFSMQKMQWNFNHENLQICIHPLLPPTTDTIRCWRCQYMSRVNAIKVFDEFSGRKWFSHLDKDYLSADTSWEHKNCRFNFSEEEFPFFWPMIGCDWESTYPLHTHSSYRHLH